MTSITPPAHLPHHRVKNLTLYLPIVYGSISRPLQNKDSGEYATHKWRLYVRSPDCSEETGRGSNPTASSGDVKATSMDGISLLSAVKQVSFHLHPSFPQPIRVVDTPNMPLSSNECGGDGGGDDSGGGSKSSEGFQGWMVEEDGWGEFEAMIKIVWNSGLVTTQVVGGAGTEPEGGTLAGGGKKQKTSGEKGKKKAALGNVEEKPLVIKHPIRLYPQNTTGAVCGPPPVINASGEAAGGPDGTDKTVIHEFYDEIVFTEPTKGFYDLVMGRNRRTGLGANAASTAAESSRPTGSKQGSSVGSPSPLPMSLSGVSYAYPGITDAKSVALMARAIRFVDEEVKSVKDRILRANSELEQADRAIEGRRKAAAAAQQQQQQQQAQQAKK